MQNDNECNNVKIVYFKPNSLIYEALHNLLKNWKAAHFLLDFDSIPYSGSCFLESFHMQKHQDSLLLHMAAIHYLFLLAQDPYNGFADLCLHCCNKMLVIN